MSRSKKQTLPERLWLIYDGRARHGDTDSATVLEVCETLEEARRSRRQYDDAVIFSCVRGADGSYTDEHMEADNE